MPLYDFVCPEDGQITSDVYLKISELDAHVQLCPACNTPMEQSFKPSAVHRPFVPYVDEYLVPDTPVLIESHAQRVKIMKEQGLEFYGRKVGNPGCEI